jgi:hypothetical protein
MMPQTDTLTIILGEAPVAESDEDKRRDFLAGLFGFFASRGRATEFI